jgi:hypothetical protein
MKFKRGFPSFLILAGLLAGAIVCNGQARNLLQNPNAESASEFWRAFGEASVETATGNNMCFVVRNGGSFIQDVALPGDVAGQYVVLIGRGASQRINDDGAITDLPYLHGYMMEDGPSNGGKVLAYLQGQRMLADTKIRDEWVNMWGIFKIPEGTKRIRFFLNQALRRGVPHDGSAARFDNLGLYIFVTREDAETFVNQYH